MPVSCRPDSLMSLHAEVTYGPVHSRRLGRSLGVNVLPPMQKVCSFNCLYCQYGWTRSSRCADAAATGWPEPGEVARAVEASLAHLADGDVSFDRITLAGHGEPTLHPQFGAIVDRLCDLRDALAPGVALAVLSNSTTADRPEVRRALARLDERYMKLDAGDQDTLRRVNASPARVDRIIEALAALPDVVLQTMFVCDPGGRCGNATPAAIDAWLAAVERIRPDAVHLYTLARQPAWPGLRGVSADFLRGVARRLRQRSVKAIVFAPDPSGE
jgi:wyosine [tRNA(Phe)-imidazoG37] synthetase (radical SAM superfamily)